MRRLSDLRLVSFLPADHVVHVALVDGGDPAVPAVVPVALLTVGLDNLKLMIGFIQREITRHPNIRKK